MTAFSDPSGGFAIRVHNLVKAYDNRRAVDDLSFDVHTGEIFALLGPNGAGKTTTVEILEGLKRADSGDIEVLGLDPGGQGAAVKSQIGVMLQEGGLYPAIRPAEALQLFRHFYSNPRDVDDLISLVGLEEARRTPYRLLSGGQKQRLALAIALLPNPALVFLDEPTAGLDAQGRRLTWEVIRGLKEEGVTILLTTHYLEEAERLADRVAVLQQGRLVALDTPSSLMGSDSSVVRLKVAQNSDRHQDLIARLRVLPSVRSVKRVEREANYVLQTSDASTLSVEITEMLRQLKVPLKELRVGAGSLEDVYLRLTGQETED